MGKSKSHKWYDEDEVYDKKSYKRDQDRRKAKKMKNALKIRDIDSLKELEDD